MASEDLKLNERATIVGMLSPDAQFRLFVNGKLAGTAAGMPISRKPNDGLSLGKDSGSFVGEYDTTSGISKAAFPIFASTGARWTRRRSESGLKGIS